MTLSQIIVSIFHWLREMDLLKWIITVAIPIGGHYIYKGLSAWWVRKRAEKLRREKFERFMEGLPISSKGLLETFKIQESHTMQLDPDDETIGLAIGLGIISHVSSSFSNRSVSYRLRDDIWAYLYKDIKLQRNQMGRPSHKSASKEDDII